MHVSVMLGDMEFTILKLAKELKMRAKSPIFEEDLEMVWLETSVFLLKIYFISILHIRVEVQEVMLNLLLN